MSNHQLTSLPVMKTQMLIRKPVKDVFEAFTNPDITTKFWFTKSSGKVEQGAELEWKWEMYDASTHAKVEKFDQNKLIRITWNIGSDVSAPSTVEWRFYPQQDGSTFVTITNKDYKGSTDDQVAEAIGSMGGFSFLLAGAKAWLEHGLQLELVADHHPASIQADE